MPKQTLNRIIIWRLVGGVIVLALVGAVLLMSARIKTVRQDLFSKQNLLELSLPAAIYQASLQDQLARYQTQIKHITTTVPTQDEIGLVISVIEEEALKLGVTVKVPTIIAEDIPDQTAEANQTDQSTNLVDKIRLDIVTTGDPLSLIKFMHVIEHLSWLIEIVSFSFDSDSTYTPNGAIVPFSGPPPPSSVAPTITPASGRLSMTMKLTIRAHRP